MILKAHRGFKVDRIWITLYLGVLIISLVQIETANAVNDYTNDLDDSVESVQQTLFGHDYVTNFMEPVTRTNRNMNMPLTRMKEMDSVLKLWNISGQEFKIVTEDGYIISLFRITSSPPNTERPSPPNKERPLPLNKELPLPPNKERPLPPNKERPLPPNKERPLPPIKERPLTPILLLHGFLAAPEIFLTRGKEDLAIILSEAGYDVWLGSYRGGYYGRRHVKFTTEDKQFWDFTFHEHGVYDVPAMIDHIIQVTKSPRVSCIGHSMSHAVFLAMLAMKPEYNNKVQLFVGLGPFTVAEINLDALTKRLVMPKLLDLIKFNKNTESTDLFRRRDINLLVTPCWSSPTMCVKLLDLFVGKNSDNGTCANLMPVVLGYFPSGTSNNNIKHMLAKQNRNFAQFDYGTSEGNMAHYNRTNPPDYNLNRVRIPISLYYGGADSVTSTKGMNAQKRALPNVVKTSIIEGYNHMDFLLASNTRQALYENILKDLNTPYTTYNESNLIKSKMTKYFKDFNKETINSKVEDVKKKTKSKLNALMKDRINKKDIQTKIKDMNADTKAKLEDVKSNKKSKLESLKKDPKL